MGQAARTQDFFLPDPENQIERNKYNVALHGVPAYQVEISTYQTLPQTIAKQPEGELVHIIPLSINRVRLKLKILQNEFEITFGELSRKKGGTGSWVGF